MWQGVYIVDWLVTPDDESRSERRGSQRVTAGSVGEAAAVAGSVVYFDAGEETVTLRVRRATARGELPPIPSPRDG